jgi:hypothetical protein
MLSGVKFVLGSAAGHISSQTDLAVAAAVDSYRTLGVEAVSFGISVLLSPQG